VLELDTLGGVERMKDSRALLLAARHFDLSDKERSKVLRRAVLCGTCDEERHVAQLNLARHLREKKALSEGLTEVRNVIAETEDDPSSHERSAALILLWTITKSQNDFTRALVEIQKPTSYVQTIGNGIELVDGAKYLEAEELLLDLAIAGDVKAKLILVDGRIRRGEHSSALELFNTIHEDEVSQDISYPYVHTMGLLVLFAGCTELRDRAIAAFERARPTGGPLDQATKQILKSLEDMR
jgi:hypothetical protein